MIAGVTVLVRRTRWPQAGPAPVDRRRAAGQMFVAAWRIYNRNRRTFLGLGAVFVPLGVIAAAQQSVLFAHSPFTDPRGVEGGDRFVSGLAALVVGSAVTALIPTVLVAAAIAMAVDALAHDRPAAISVRGTSAGSARWPARCSCSYRRRPPGNDL